MGAGLHKDGDLLVLRRWVDVGLEQPALAVGIGVGEVGDSDADEAACMVQAGREVITAD